MQGGDRGFSVHMHADDIHKIRVWRELLGKLLAIAFPPGSFQCGEYSLDGVIG